MRAAGRRGRARLLRGADARLPHARAAPSGTARAWSISRATACEPRSSRAHGDEPRARPQPVSSPAVLLALASARRVRRDDAARPALRPRRRALHDGGAALRGCGRSSRAAARGAHASAPLRRATCRGSSSWPLLGRRRRADGARLGPAAHERRDGVAPAQPRGGLHGAPRARPLARAHRRARRRWPCSAMVAGGALLVFDGSDALSVAAGWGALAVVVATLAWASDNVVGRPLAERDPGARRPREGRVGRGAVARARASRSREGVAAVETRPSPSPRAAPSGTGSACGSTCARSASLGAARTGLDLRRRAVPRRGDRVGARRARGRRGDGRGGGALRVRRRAAPDRVARARAHARRRWSTSMPHRHDDGHHAHAHDVLSRRGALARAPARSAVARAPARAGPASPARALKGHLPGHRPGEAYPSSKGRPAVSLLPVRVVGTVSVAVLVAACSRGSGTGPAPGAPPPVFDEVVLDTAFRAEGVAVFDVDHDGHLDLVTDQSWYAGPSFTPHEIRTPQTFDGATGYSVCQAVFARRRRRRRLDRRHRGAVPVRPGQPAARTDALVQEPGRRGRALDVVRARAVDCRRDRRSSRTSSATAGSRSSWGRSRRRCSPGSRPEPIRRSPGRRPPSARGLPRRMALRPRPRDRRRERRRQGRRPHRLRLVRADRRSCSLDLARVCLRREPRGVQRHVRVRRRRGRPRRRPVLDAARLRDLLVAAAACGRRRPDVRPSTPSTEPSRRCTRSTSSTSTATGRRSS